MLAELNHPNLVRVVDAGTHEDRPFLVMEHVPGLNLAQYAAECHPTPRRAAAIVAELARAAAFLHRRGIIHQDIKPKNILIDEAGRPRLIDFGQAWQRNAWSEGPGAFSGGTPVYMAPEQADGWSDQIAPRTDVFGLGAVLYELLTGRPPYQAATRSVLMEQAREGRVIPLRQVAPSVPRALERICLRAMARDPADRYAEAADLERALRRYRGRPAVAALMVVAVCAVLTVLALAWGARPSPEHATALAEAPRPVTIALEIQHARGEDAIDLGLIGHPSHVSRVEVDDDVRVRVRLDPPAYGYLLALNPDGSVTVCVPATPTAPPCLSAEIQYPSRPRVYYALTEGVGLQAFVLVSARWPLPPDCDWAAGRALPWASTDADRAWRFDGRGFQPLGGVDRGPERARGPQPPPALAAVCEFLAAAPEWTPSTPWPSPSGRDPRIRPRPRPWSRPAAGRPRRAAHRGAGETGPAAGAGRPVRRSPGPGTGGPVDPRVEGAKHWETADVEGKLRSLERIARLPPECRAELTAAIRAVAEGTEQFQRGDFAAARQRFEKALAIDRQILGHDHLDTAQAGNDLATCLFTLGEHVPAERLLREALETHNARLGPAHIRTAGVMINLAADLNALGRFDEAEALYVKALKICHGTWSEPHAETAAACNNLATLLGGRGRFDEAEPLLREALAIYRAILGDDRPETAIAYSNLATNLNARGHFAEAEPLLRTALTIFRRALGEDHPRLVTVYHNLAANLHDQNRNAEAEGFFRTALTIGRKVLPENHRDLAMAYDGLAMDLDLQGKHAEAEPMLREAVRIYTKASGELHADTALAINNVAINFENRKKYAEAEPLFRAAGHLPEDAGGSPSLHGIGLVQSGCEPQLAGPVRRGRATASRSASGPVVGPGRGTRRHGDRRERAGHASPVPGPVRRGRGVVGPGRGALRGHPADDRCAGLGRSVSAAWRSPLPFLSAALARRGQALSAWHRLEAGLARGLFEDLARPLTSADETHEHNLLTEIHRLDEQITALGSRGDRKGAAEPDRPLRERREAREIELLRLEADFDGKYGAEVGAPYDLPRIQSQLPADAALVAYLDLDAPADGVNPAGDHWACVVRSHGDPAWIRLSGRGPAGAWTEDDQRQPAVLRGECCRRPDLRGTGWAGIGAEMAARRLDPLEPCLAARDGLPTVRRLIVLNSPALAGVPIEILQEAPPPGRPRYTISYAPSATILAWLRQRPSQPPRSQPPRLLALGDPEFAPDAAGPNALAQQAASAGPVPIPGSRLEVQAIARLFEQPTLLLGPDASERRLDELAAADRLRQFAFLHLATHAKMDDRFFLQSALLLVSDPPIDPARRERDTRPRFDGRLTAEQIRQTWKLDANLVVLSACQSGLGLENRGEGYLGFAQVLFLAGAAAWSSPSGRSTIRPRPCS